MHVDNRGASHPLLRVSFWGYIRPRTDLLPFSEPTKNLVETREERQQQQPQFSSIALRCLDDQPSQVQHR